MVLIDCLHACAESSYPVPSTVICQVSAMQVVCHKQNARKQETDGQNEDEGTIRLSPDCPITEITLTQLQRVRRKGFELCS